MGCELAVYYYFSCRNSSPWAYLGVHWHFQFPDMGGHTYSDISNGGI